MTEQKKWIETTAGVTIGMAMNNAANLVKDKYNLEELDAQTWAMYLCAWTDTLLKQMKRQGFA